MTLQQFHSLKLWHTHHVRPLEKNVWDVVLTLWMAGWIGGAVSIILATPSIGLFCVALVFLPGAYVGLRARLHRAGRLRCDWINALR